MNGKLFGFSQKGQTSILFVLVFITLFVFFAFVVNLGLIVHHKINLQQTADLAAYAGASWQARAMDGIAIENFRMRQDYKEYTMHTWITFGRFPDTWLTARNGRGFVDETTSSSYQPILCPFCGGYSNFDPATCYCSNLKADFSGINNIEGGFSDPSSIAIQEAIKSFQVALQNDCKRVENESARIFRAFHSIYFFDPIPGTSPTTRDFPPSPVAGPQGGSGGLLYQRARHIKKLVVDFNQAASTDILNGKNSTLDRTVKKTIEKNLNQTLYDGLNNSNCATCGAFAAMPKSGYSVEAPEGDDASTMVPLFLKLKQINYLFNAGYINTKDDNAATGACTVDGATNRFLIGSLDFGVPIMFTKDESVMTYYAVRLRSRPRLLYLPQSWTPILTAYASAKPFGGRIGPDVKSNAYRNSVEGKYLAFRIGNEFYTTSSGARQPQSDYSGKVAFANVAMYPSDEYGWGDPDIRKNFTHPEMMPSSSGPTAARPGASNKYPGFFISRDTEDHSSADGMAYLWSESPTQPGDYRRDMVDASRAPNAFDAMMFSIFPNPSVTSGITDDDFRTRNAYLQFPRGVYYTNQADGSYGALENDLAGFDTDIFFNFYGTDGDYVNTGKLGFLGGHNPQDRLPYTDTILFDTNLTVAFGDGRPTGAQLMSSWAPADELASASPFGNVGSGRTGYSVKFISFQSLANPGFFQEDGSEPADNTQYTFGGETDPALPAVGDTDLTRKVLH